MSTFGLKYNDEGQEDD
ncbi:e2f989fe-cd08-45b6-9c26-3675d3a45b3d [Thermothielavioides terrestris]|uniref:E2f989fe-cd08-45b6-9c26-3675d3a45b3d n=1 Tax=Thermothielavioides terrestris TaxID=2587410 RepID=A0A3S4EWR2_9PEZI|nr:e2f989fe-cd08-45b6-9c26-3675d3a45b3d [Thermothielavioides terrestris]